MPNALGLPSPGNPSKFRLSLPLFDPRLVRSHRERFYRDMLPDLEKANCFYCPGGRWPSLGFVLVRLADFAALQSFTAVGGLYATTLALQMDDYVNPPITLQNLALVSGRCATRGNPLDPASVYLLQLTDMQGVMYNPWFQFPTSSQYNMVAPAYPGRYYSASLNAGNPWTWNQLIGDLWNQMSAFLGPYPGLPSAPAATPENFAFPGVSCWEALNLLLELQGFVVATNLQNANPFTIVSAGSPDPAFTAMQNAHAGVLEDDLEYQATGSGRVPKTVIVYFHRSNQYYGTEETVRSDSFQWTTTPSYSVTVAGPYPVATGTAYLWSDFPVRYDVNGTPLAADTARAMAIASDLTTAFFNTIIRGTSGSLQQVYAGALPFSTGSLCDGVKWSQDFRDRDRQGWRTEILRGWLWDEVRFSLGAKGLRGE